jgi:hypothetical protein
VKLSDIKGERTFDVIADIIDPIAAIAEDEDAAALFKPEELPDGLTPWQFFLKRVRRSLPPLMRAHKREIATIMATINGQTVDEYMAEISLGKLLADLTELLGEEEFLSFFG